MLRLLHINFLSVNEGINMANALYDLAKQKLLQGDIAWLTDNIKAVLVDNALYTVNLVTDEFLSDIIAGARVATSPNLTSKTSTLGVADAANVTFPSVSGAISEEVVLYVDTGVEATSSLIAIVDTATGLPVTPDGNNINVLWDDGVNRIFAI